MIYDVIVIGAGLSGLTAANKLAQNNQSVLVLEARDRVGGRVNTNHDFSVPVDLGASWVHDLPNNQLAKDFSDLLDLLPFSDLLDQFEEHVAYGQFYKLQNTQTLKQIKNFVGDFFKQINNISNKPLTTILENIYPKNLDQDSLPVIKKWLENLLACWAGDGLAKTHPELWKSMTEEGDMSYVLNGFDQVINKLSKNLTIHLNSPVKLINYQTTKNKTHITIETTSQFIYKAKKVIVTIPIGVLKSENWNFVPKLPADKQLAIKQIGNGILNKAVLKFEKCFWDKDALSIQCFPSRQSDIQVYINYQAMYGEPILVALYGGDVARHMEQLELDNISEVENQLLAPLKNIYGNKFQSPEKIFTTKWQADPYALGAYSYLAAGSSLDCFDKLAEPIENKIYFAGEATDSKYYATAHGAYMSGLRVAKEVLQK